MKQNKNTYNPGTWVKYRNGYAPKTKSIIVHRATYVEEGEEFYFIYNFTGKGKFSGSAFIHRRALKRITTPEFAADVYILPIMLKPKEKHEMDLFRGGMIYTRQNLVVIDSFVLSSKVLSKYISNYFKDQDSWDSPDCHACDGLVYSPKSWIAEEVKSLIEIGYSYNNKGDLVKPKQ